MLISYPIIPADSANQTEAQRFDAMLALTQHDRGLYPVTSGNRWHGGIHLTPGNEPIRAIADGVIVAYRLAPETRSYPGQGEYDTSFVLIKHDTETGENTRVVFYSLYMHLKPKARLTNAERDQVIPFLRNAATGNNAVQAPANSRVWRKEVVGFGGQLYDVPTVHFEIFATEAGFQAFWRDRNAIAAGHHGSDDVFGQMHFVIPAGRSFTERHPRASPAPHHRIDFPGRNQFFDLAAGQTGQNTDRLHVVVELSQGRRTAISFRLDNEGRITGQVGQPVVQEEYEYELFRLATALYPDCPSAGFEYLRFGRRLGPDRTQRIENWQLIRYADTALGYINLADPSHQVSVLSDADFPILWQRLEENEAAQASDGSANVPRLTELLQLPSQPSTTQLSAPPEFAARARNPNVAALLRNFICKHPSEWDASDLEARYAALRLPGMPLNGDAAWNDFKTHCEAMAFWPQSGIAGRSVWHFHPLRFVEQYRCCLWLSEREIKQLLPMDILRQSGQAFVSESPSMTIKNRQSGLSAQDVLINYRTELNKALRKYLIASPIRLAGFFANATQETWWLQKPHESNSAERYHPWDGRGFLQLTWPRNYIKYFRFRGRDVDDHEASRLDQAAVTADASRSNQSLRDENTRASPAVIAWRQAVAEVPEDAAESAGAYWAWMGASRYADNFNGLVRETARTASGVKYYYVSESFRQVGASINYPGWVNSPGRRFNGYVDRCTSYANALVVLTCGVTFQSAAGDFSDYPDQFRRRIP